nr:TniQ family protein [Anabaena azotica]
MARWEKFRFNPPPSRQQLEALAKVLGVDADRLAQMLPPAGVGMKMEPIRLCGACYAESPCHKIEWQLKITQGCELHNLRLLSECPNCGARFKIPALWVNGCCHRCFLPFAEMVKYHKQIDLLNRNR